MNLIIKLACESKTEEIEAFGEKSEHQSSPILVRMPSDYVCPVCHEKTEWMHDHTGVKL